MVVFYSLVSIRPVALLTASWPAVVATLGLSDGSPHTCHTQSEWACPPTKLSMDWGGGFF